MKYRKAILAFTALIGIQGCRSIGYLEALAPSCLQEQLVVTWPVTITRGSSVTSTLLTRTMTPGSIDRSQFDALRQTLTQGGSAGTYNVTWAIPAFDVNGSYIALAHAAPLAAGETQQVGTAFSGSGWTAQPANAALPPAVSVRAGDFVATTASGSITALNTVPLRLRIDVTAANATGETIRLTGEAGFHFQEVTALCR